MATQINLHPIQGKILRTLLFATEARFSDLNTEKLSNDHFTFHINQLVSQDLLIKTASNKYELTNKGKEFASRLDKEAITVGEPGKVGVLIVCIDTANRAKKFLVQQRLRQPYYGSYGFITGKVLKGKGIYEVAEGQLLEEANLKAKLQLVGINHKIDLTSDKKLLEDKYYFVFKAENPKGILKKEFKEGKNSWMTLGEIKKIDNFRGIDILTQLIKTDKLTFSEKKSIQNNY